jgi:aldehyde:ferredoxin oxidoreductase
MAKLGGWAGKTLRIDLSTGKITKEDTVEKYKDFLGGTGLGYKVLWDEVPAGTKPFDPANKIIFATGPMAGTGMPCNGRTAVTTIFPTVWPKPLVASGHMGGHFAAKLKYAGYDAVIIEGKADKPVWISIRDEEVQIKDARHVWGQGIRRTNLELSQELGNDSVVAAIGQAGENQLPMAVVMNSVSHSAGGVGGVMGSKNLKAIGVVGTGAVHLAGDKAEWEKLVKFHLSILGANNQHVVPNSPQPWSEYFSPGSRWVASRGLEWGMSRPPVQTGSCDPHDLNRIAYRSNNFVYFHSKQAWKYTVRGNGCTSCPIRCHTIIKMPLVASKYGISDTAQNTCVGLMFGGNFFKGLPGGRQGQQWLEANMVGMSMSDDLGLWCNYSQMQRDVIKMYYDGHIKAKLSEKEFKSYNWEKYEKGDASFLFELLPRIANKDGELATLLGLGTGYHLERWGIPESEWTKDYGTMYWKQGHPKHHANEDDGQCGVIVNTQYNRDCQNHSHANFVRSGLPTEVQKKLAEDVWGSADAVDGIADYKPMNKYKAKRAKWTSIRKELHDSLSICNWMGPWIASPLKERGYSGDDTLESRFYSLATGNKIDREELDKIGERIFVLHRALTIRDMGTKNMKTEHDKVPDWIFEDKTNQAPFTKGTIRMDREDIKKGMEMYYTEMGWDTSTGSPTKKTYEKLGLKDVADKLAAKKLL